MTAWVPTLREVGDMPHQNCVLVRRLALCAAFLLGASGVFAQNPTATVNVDLNLNRRAINPLIYGVAHAGTTALSDLNSPLNRNGGNNTSRYNWNLNADNRGSDWYFESIADASSTAGERGDTFVSNTKAAGAQAMLTVPMLAWVAKLGASRGKLASYSIQKYGSQTGNDWQWFPDAGNGIRASDGAAITWNDPNDANVSSSSTFQQGWVNHLVGRWGAASAGGLKYYILDNEPGLWHGTHRDVQPTGVTMDAYRDKVLDYAGKIKATDASALVVAPEEWGWSGYLYSGYDQQYGSQHGWSFLPDRSNHGGWDFLPWLLDQLRQNNTATGKRLLDVFTVHYYPQGGEFSDDVSSAMQLRRNRSTRSLWDPSYVDESWIGTQVKLIPRLKGWVASYYPSTPVGITEYNWGAEGHISGALAQADIWGIFGREGLDLGARWTTPGTTTPTCKAMKMYRNYDGSKSTFGDTSVSATGPNADNVAAFAAQRTSDGALTLMVLSKYLSGTTPVTVNMANFTSQGVAQPWQLTSSNSINRLADISFGGSSFSASLPAQSITLFVIPRGAAAPTLSSSATASPSTVSPGSTSTITASFTCTGGSLAGGIVDLEVYNPSGSRVAQQFWTGQSFATGQVRTYTYVWTAPATTGVYSVALGVFGANWAPNYHWHGNAAAITVAAGDTAQYSFESSAQGWTHSGGIISGVARSTAQAFRGSASLAVSFNGAAAGTQQAFVGSPSTPAGRTVTFHVWFPTGSKLSSIQPYVQQGAGGGWLWTGNWQAITSLTAGAWNTITVTVPSNAVTPLYQLGVQFATNAAWTGTCYIDTVSW
jgi:Glycoside hydrolase family 44